MSIGVATSFATTLVQYFSPTKSPFYPIVAMTVVALEWSVEVRGNWSAIFWPLVMVLMISTTLAFLNRPDFDEREYNDQVKFARAAGVSSGVLCLTWLAVSIAPYPAQPNYHYWTVYWCCIIQAAVLLLYTFVYFNKEVVPHTVNFVQLALMTATFIVGATYAAKQFDYALPAAERETHELVFSEIPYWISEPKGRIFSVLILGWVACMILWCNHLRKVFRLTINPSDIRVQPSSNVVPMVKPPSTNDQMAS